MERAGEGLLGGVGSAPADAAHHQLSALPGFPSPWRYPRPPSRALPTRLAPAHRRGASDPLGVEARAPLLARHCIRGGRLAADGLESACAQPALPWAGA